MSWRLYFLIRVHDWQVSADADGPARPSRCRGELDAECDQQVTIVGRLDNTSLGHVHRRRYVRVGVVSNRPTMAACLSHSDVPLRIF